MNIFVTDICPYRSAVNLDNKRVVKMVLESAQMLSTAINEHGRGKVTGPYKSTHVNHPCNVWARETRANYVWLLEHFEGLCEQYQVRYNKTHKCSQYLKDFTMYASIIPKGSITPFANCAAHKGKDISYKHIKPTTLAYQMYLVTRWNTDVRKPIWVEHDMPAHYPPYWAIVNKNKFYHKESPTWQVLYG